MGLQPWYQKTLAPWKKSYDQPRQYIKKQRHYFANRGPSSQGYGFPVVMYACESWTIKKAERQRIDAFELWCWKDSWEFLGLQGDPSSPFWRRSTLAFLWKEWCDSWNSSTLATSCEELTHWKRLWCWGGLGAGGKGDDRGWDGWMASRTRWTCEFEWIPGVGDGQGGLACCDSWGRKESDVTERLNWTELNWGCCNW